MEPEVSELTALWLRKEMARLPNGGLRDLLQQAAGAIDTLRKQVRCNHLWTGEDDEIMGQPCKFCGLLYEPRSPYPGLPDSAKENQK